jgi:predicted nucleic acid-binding Zn ribbon protein
VSVDGADPAPNTDQAPDHDVPTAGEAVKAALGRARAAARAKGLRPGSPPSLTGIAAAAKRRRDSADNRSSSHPDARDPQPLALAVDRLVAERGWNDEVAVGGVVGRWAEVVGDDIATHCRPQSFTEGVLTVQADSTAWATQVRLLIPTLMRRLAEAVGDGVVSKVVVLGPTGPSWRRGPRVAPGSQGPRDTYG